MKKIQLIQQDKISLRGKNGKAKSDSRQMLLSQGKYSYTVTFSSYYIIISQ